jgi:putative endonuclease
MFNKLSSRQVGNNAEDLAESFLKGNGFKILSRNFTIRGGEIDIIAREDENLVFVEVKARYNHKFGLPIESITPWKLKALQKSALFYIQKVNWGNRPYRFDLVSIDYADSISEPAIELVRNII